MLRVLINVLFAGQTSDRCLADAFDAAWNVVYSHGDGIITVQTSARDGHQLAAFSMAIIVADTADGRHDLDSVAGYIVIGTRLNRARIIHSVACTTEECGDGSSRIADIGLNRARDVIHVIGGHVVFIIVDSAQVHAGAINAKINWQLAWMLVMWRFLWINSDHGMHTWVDHGGNHIVDDGCEVPIVLDLAMSGIGAGQMIF